MSDGDLEGSPPAAEPGQPERGTQPERIKQPERGEQPRKRKKQPSLAKELPILVIVAIGLAFLIKSLLVQAFFIPSGSMQNTLQIHDRVLVNKLVYDFRDPHRGEIVVFNGKNSGFANLDSEGTPPSSNALVNGIRHVQSFIGLAGNPNEKDFIKRVIAVGGDTVSCPAIPGDASRCRNVLVNGRAIDESSYLFENMQFTAPYQRVFPQTTVPKGQLWVMGDHRDYSSDSRFNGTIPVNEVIGRAFVTVWPPSRIGGLGVPKAFQNLAAASGGAVPLAAGLLVFPVAGLRRRRRGAA